MMRGNNYQVAIAHFQISAPMEEITEKLTIKITDSGIVILSGEENSLHFTSGEALMLLDILKNEEPRLRKMAEEALSIPIKNPSLNNIHSRGSLLGHKKLVDFGYHLSRTDSLKKVEKLFC